MFGESAFERVSTERPPGASHKQRSFDSTGSLCHPHSKKVDRALRQGGDSLFPAFALAADVSADVEVDIAAPKSEQLGCSKAGLSRKAK